jgi:hypothetical protein
MKNSTPSLSPFLFLIFPVLLFVGLSFGLQKEIAKNSIETTTYTLNASKVWVIKSSQKSFFKLLLK